MNRSSNIVTTRKLLCWIRAAFGEEFPERRTGEDRDGENMLDLSIADSLGLAFFFIVWVFFRFVNERGFGKTTSLSVLMDEQRMAWMRAMS